MHYDAVAYLQTNMNLQKKLMLKKIIDGFEKSGEIDPVQIIEAYVDAIKPSQERLIKAFGDMTKQHKIMTYQELISFDEAVQISSEFKFGLSGLLRLYSIKNFANETKITKHLLNIFLEFENGYNIAKNIAKENTVGTSICYLNKPLDIINTFAKWGNTRQGHLYWLAVQNQLKLSEVV